MSSHFRRVGYFKMAVVITVAAITSCHTQKSDKRGGFSNYLPSFSRAGDSQPAQSVASDLGLNTSSFAGAVACDLQNGILSIHLAKIDPAGKLYRPTLGSEIKVTYSINGSIDKSKCQSLPNLHEIQCPAPAAGETLTVAATVTLANGDSGDTGITKCTGS